MSVAEPQRPASSARRSKARRATMHLVLPSLTALGMAAALPPLEWFPLAWIALVPLCVVLSDRTAFAETYIGVYLGGLVFQLLHLDWMRTAYGSQGVSGPHALNWLLQGVVVAVFWVLLVFVGRAIYRKRPMPMTLLLPVLWVAFEFGRKQLWRTFVDQTGTPWGMLGYSQLRWLPIVQIADLGGVYAIGGLLAMVNGALWDLMGLWRGRTASRSGRWAPLAAVLCVAAAAAYGGWRLSENAATDGPTVMLMPAWTPKITEKHPLDRPVDILLWSELDSNQTIWEMAQARAVGVEQLADEVRRIIENPTAEMTADVVGMFEQQAKQFDATLVIGCERLVATPQRMTKYNSMACVHPTRGYLGAYDKVFLVPWTEFTPRTPFRVFHRGSRGYTPGERCPVFPARCAAASRDFLFTPSICYDNCFEEFYTQAMRSDDGPPDFFLHGGSEGQDRSYRLALNMLRMSQLRAIECRRAIVRNIAYGYSGLIDANGRYSEVADRVIHQPTWIGAIPVDRRSSLYVRFGNWFAWTAIVTCGLLWLIPRRRPQAAKAQG